jgi:hypothetical protein
MKARRYMDPLSVVLNKLKMKDHAHEAVMLADGFVRINGTTYKNDSLSILKTYRFEGESDPGDAAILYLICSADGSIGYCIDGYGMYSSHTSDFYSDFIQNAKVRQGRN